MTNSVWFFTSRFPLYFLRILSSQVTKLSAFILLAYLTSCANLKTYHLVTQPSRKKQSWNHGFVVRTAHFRILLPCLLPCLRTALPSKRDWGFCLSSPPASPESEANGGQVESQKKILSILPAPPVLWNVLPYFTGVGGNHRTGVNPVGMGSSLIGSLTRRGPCLWATGANTDLRIYP